MNKPEEVPPWFGWIVDRGVVFWRMFLLIVAAGFIVVAILIHARLRQIEQNLSYEPPLNTAHIDLVDLPDEIAKGQTVFVPAYSHVYHQDGKPFALTVTLSIHNADLEESIVVSTVDYFGTDGKLVRKFVQQPKKLAPLGSLEFLIAEEDVEGGSGAKFIVTWVADRVVHEPVIQSVMVGTSGGQGLSFVGNAVVLEEVDDEATDETTNGG